MNFVHIHPESIEAIARRTAELLNNQPADSDPWLTRGQAAQYLNLPKRTFDRYRLLHTEALKPCSEHPLRWSRNALDSFKLSRGNILGPRRGRKPGHGV